MYFIHEFRLDFIVLFKMAHLQAKCRAWQDAIALSWLYYIILYHTIHWNVVYLWVVGRCIPSNAPRGESVVYMYMSISIYTCYMAHGTWHSAHAIAAHIFLSSCLFSRIKMYNMNVICYCTCVCEVAGHAVRTCFVYVIWNLNSQNIFHYI